jgi:hypothetical protein
LPGQAYSRQFLSGLIGAFLSKFSDFRAASVRPGFCIEPLGRSAIGVAGG